MSEFKLIYEAYLNQGAMAKDQQRKKQIPGLTPKTDFKNSNALKTSLLPGGGGGDFNQARMGTGISIDEEEVVVKGVGKMKKSDVDKMYEKIMTQVHTAKKQKNKEMLLSKIEMLAALAKHI